MSNIHQLFGGVQMVHKSNHTYTTREGYAYKDDYEQTPELEFDNTLEVNQYFNLNPGLYKVNIDGTMYALMIHDTISGSNYLAIKNKKKAYTVLGLNTHPIPLYIFHEGNTIESRGHVLPHTVNDRLDLFIMDGETRCKAGNHVSMRYPGLLELISIMNIHIKTEDTIDEYLFNMKNYLKSVRNGRHCVRDTMYLDAARDTAMFIFRTGRLVLSGEESYEYVPELSTEYVNVFKYDLPLAKASGLIQCSHLPTIKWKHMKDTSYINEGICISPEGYGRAIYMKVPVLEYADLEAFSKDVKRWFKVSKSEERFIQWNRAREEARILGMDPDKIHLHSIVACPVTIIYELERQTYKQLTLEDYDIKTKFNKCWLDVHPYRPVGKYTIEEYEELEALIPKNGYMRTMKEQEELSGNPEMRNRIIKENTIWNELFADYRHHLDLENGIIPWMSYQEPMSGRASYYNRILDDNNIWRDELLFGQGHTELYRYEMQKEETVAVIPKSDGTTPLGEMPIPYEEYQQNQSGFPEKYNEILEENIIWRDLVLGRALLGGYIFNIEEVSALKPISGAIPWMAEQLEESGYENRYQTILDNNELIQSSDIILTGYLNIRTMYFYKHLRVS